MTEQKLVCSECGRVMVLRNRRSDGAKFWGCSGFPTCRNTRPYNPHANEPVKEFKPTSEQLAVFKYIQDPDGGDAVVEAMAGSGKTTLIIQALRFTKGKVIALAFNKRIAEWLSKIIPAHVRGSTIHSLGFACLNSALPSKPIVDEDKKYGIAKELLPNDNERFERGILVKLAACCQNTLADPTDADVVAKLIERFNIEMDGCEEKVLKLLPILLAECAKRTGVIDYDDMIWLPVILNLPVEKFDWVFVDERQDLNVAQFEFIKRLVNEYGRVVAVGDTRQSIYGFRGADVESYPRWLREMNNVKVFPLTITFRCPVSHVKLARQLAPELKAADWAEAGEVIENMPEWKATQELRDGDMVLCRINAPLVAMCYQLIRSGKKATIVGRDIGKGLIALIDKLQPVDVQDLMGKLRDYKFKEVQKLEAAGKTNQASNLEDKCDTLIALCDGVYDLSLLRARIEQIFSDKVTGIALSSVHRAKGLEADNVYILAPQLMPFPRAVAEWEQIQEKNCLYVACTRAKKKLVFIDGGVPSLLVSQNSEKAVGG